MKFSKNITGFTDEKQEADDDTRPSPLLPVCMYETPTWYTFKTSPCMPAPRAHVEKTCARGAGIHGVFSVSHTTHTTHTTHHTTTHHNNTTTTPHGDRHRERDKERRGDEREEDKRIEERKREEREKILFQCGGAWPFFIDGVLFLVSPICARDLSLLNSVKFEWLVWWLCAYSCQG